MTADSILVLKHGAIGDVIQAMDAFAGLRQAHPEAEITLLTTAPFARLLSTSNWFDHIIVDPRLPGWRLDQAIRLRSFFAQGWDMVIDLQCSARTKRYYKYFFAKQSGRWFGDARGCSDPIPDFTNVNNRDRMVRTCLAARSGQPTIMVMGKDTDPSMSAPLGAKAGYLRAEAIGDVTAQQIFDKALSMRA